MSVIDHAAFLARLREDGWEFPVIFDIGASIGGWTRHAQTAFPDSRFELFEPLAGQVDALDQASTWDTLVNCGFHRLALSDANGEVIMKVLGNRGVGSSIVAAPGDERKDLDRITVTTRRLDDYLIEAALPQPDFLKLDVQAAELKVLEGGQSTISRAKMLLVETWARRVYGPSTPLFHELANWLYERDFVLFDLLIPEDGRDANLELRWFDAVFVNKAHSRHASRLL